MNTESKVLAKDLTAGTWIVTEYGVSVVENVTNYGNGWIALDLSDGRMVDCLAFRSFTLA